MSTIIDDLQWRGLVAQTTDEVALREHLGSSRRSIYCGFDPTAPSLHFGNLVQLIVLRHLQRAGHRVVCLVGGSTGLIGDPRPTAERVLRSKDETADNVTRIRELVRPFLNFEGDNPAIIVNNLDWTEPISALDFLRDIGKHFRVNQMIRKDAVAARLASQEGISYTEFSYQILQALDFLHLFRSEGVTVQTGGQDQWGNLTAGVDLVHRVEGQSVHVLTTPLLTDDSGKKFGKTAGNAIWLSPDMTSAYAFYQYWINIADADVIRLIKVFTDRDPADIETLRSATEESPHRRSAQQALAADVTTLVHGSTATANVREASQVLFGHGDPAAVDAGTWLEATAALPAAQVSVTEHVQDALVAAELAPSRGAARRLIAEGGVSINNAKVTDSEAALSAEDFLHGQVALLKRGRKNLAALRPNGRKNLAALRPNGR
ncbi:MAG: tyrosine--tRNA ligase [Ornithinimicrobium sp.]